MGYNVLFNLHFFPEALVKILASSDSKKDSSEWHLLSKAFLITSPNSKLYA